MKEVELVQLPYQGYRMRQMADKSWQSIFDHPELLPEQVTGMVSNSSSVGWLAVKPNDQVKDIDMPKDAAPVESDMRTPSQQLRGRIFRLWEAGGSKGDFETYYRRMMNYFIETINRKLEP